MVRLFSRALGLLRVGFKELLFISNKVWCSLAANTIGSKCNAAVPYVKPIVALFKEEYDIHGLAHITGGGFTNLRRLKKGVGYDIYDLPEAPEIFKLIYQQNVPLEEMYKVFNMGIGFVVITNENEAEKIMETLKDYCNCQIIGKVTDDEKITVKTFEGSEVTY